MRKLLIRVTIGGSISDSGYELFRYSLKRLKKLFDKAEIVVCFNDISRKKLVNLGVDLIDQEAFKDSLPYAPSGVSWKLYPPRIDMDCHEIFIDNDVVLHKIPNEIKSFLLDETSFVYTEGLFRCNGNFEWPPGFTLNSGLFGLPPNFDFKKELVSRMKGVSWEDYFDEQGIVGQIISSQSIIRKIDLQTIAVLARGLNFNEEMLFSLFGFHFVGANRGDIAHWDFYKSKFLKLQ
jgi:hypothetical protein